ncbi:MAG: 2-hydroxyacid dehydrogenase [Burkholderiales bacterium]|nr:2-hydroxyacid dehydrogenase [Burkholderiales bacterium]
MQSRAKPTILLTGRVQSSLMGPLDKEFDVVRLWEAKDRRSALAAVADKVEVVVTTAMYGATADLIAALPRLRLIASFGVGYDTIDVAAAHARGIAVTTTPDVLNECVADLALALLLDITRRVSQADRFVRAGLWAKERFIYGTKLGGKTCGILGLGAIGLEIAKRATAFGMHVAYCNRKPRPDVDYRYINTVAELAHVSDFMILAVPGGADTHHIVDRAILAALGPKGFIINIARGAVIDEAVLVEMLERGEIAGAALDVFEHEPRVPDALFKLDNVVLTPHIASATHETRQAMGDLVLDNVRALLAGQPLPTALVVA